MTFDLALLDGKICTENPSQSEAEAIGIVGNRIALVGSSKEVLGGCTAQTRVAALGGRRVLPGFNDAHVHFYLGGASLSSVQLRDANSVGELRERVAAFAGKQPKGEWILLGSWDPERWPTGSQLDCRLIDEVTPEHPVFLTRADAHTSVANSLAMKLAGVTDATADVSGGEIGRRADGTLNGIFKDAAQALIIRAIPPPTKGQMVRALQAAQTHASRNGITSIQDMGLLGIQALQCSADLFRAYQELHHSGNLTVRVSLHTPLAAWKRLADLGVRAWFGNERLRIGGVKAFADGSLASRTAWFFEPYADAEWTCGIPSDDMSNPEQMLNDLAACDEAGLQLAVHAIGDRANHEVLACFEEIERRNGRRDRRWRIEHAQHVRSCDLHRFSDSGVVASVQPYHLSDDGRWAETRIGKERAKETYAFRSLIDAGAKIALGSDWYVAPINPLLTIWAATTRRTLDGAYPDGWVSEQKISVQEAVHAYTVGAAYASGDEQIKGSLQTGKLADIAVLSADIFSIDPADIGGVQVDMTVFDGRIVFERD